MSVNGTLIQATLVEVEKTLAAATTADAFGAQAVASFLQLTASVYEIDTQTQQNFLAYSLLHVLVNSTMPAANFW